MTQFSLFKETTDESGRKEARQYYVARTVQARGLYPNSTHYPEGRSMKIHLN